MPPEYIERRHISMKFDVFSLGVIIIEIMAGPSGRSTSAEMSPQQFIDTVRIVFFFSHVREHVKPVFACSASILLSAL